MSHSAQRSQALHAIGRSRLTGPAAFVLALACGPMLSAPAHADEGTTFSWGGYVKLDLMYSTSSSGTPSSVTDYAIIPGAIPVPTSETGGNFNLNARESRFWLGTTTPSSFGDVRTHIEIDFVGFDSNLGNERTSSSSSPRLRHAYGTWNGFLAGQYWTTWMDLKALPEKNDFGSPAGRAFARQAMIRYTHALEGLGELQVAVENPESALTGPDGARIVPSDDVAPETVVKFETNGAWGHVAAAGIVRFIRADGVIATAADVDDLQIGFGGRLSGKLMIGGKHNIRFDATGGSGIGRYIAFNGFNDGELNADGTIDLINLVAGILSVQVWLNDSVRFNIAGSGAQALNNSDDPALGTQNQQILSTHANIMWSATPSVRLALEQIFVTRTREDDQSGDLFRTQFSFRYTF